jgi:wyosine [tRNA(Phe)-imidazoG37] synthetase (radical SAM superfamily)
VSENRHVFGPVPSRRLGRSLGVDLVPYKTCTYDCVYCQLGRTTNLTIARSEYVPTAEVIREIEQVLAAPAPPDYVTFSGSGEPTLHTGLGDIIDAVKRITTVPVAVLTNGSLLYDPDVRDDCMKADLVVPSLDAADPKMFRCVNRPHRDISFLKTVTGIADFRKDFPGSMWLEVFLLYGVTGVGPYVRRMLPWIEKIGAEKVQINTAVRPGTEDSARPVPDEDLRDLATIIREVSGPNVEIVASSGAHQKQGEFVAQREDVLAMLRRRPCSIEDVAAGLGIHRNEAIKYIDELEKAGRIRSETRQGITFFSAT